MESLSYEFLITSLIVVLLPGTGVIYTVSTGLFQGGRASIVAALGCTLGIVPHLIVSSLGLSTLLNTGAIAFQIIRFLGAAYLMYLSWTMWRQTGNLDFTKPESLNKKLWLITWKAILVNLLNPKLSIFFLAFLPLFVDPSASSPAWHFLVLSSVFMLMTLGGFYHLWAICPCSKYLFCSVFFFQGLASKGFCNNICEFGGEAFNISILRG